MRQFILTSRRAAIVLLLILPLFAFGQRDVTYSQVFKLDSDLIEQVKEGMSKHHRKYRSNDFYNFNVNTKPLFESPDSIAYNVKIIAASRLWGMKGKFTKSGDKLVCEISGIVILKKTGMSGVDYVNMAVNDMEDTKGNRINLVLFEEQLDKFFKCFR